MFNKIITLGATTLTALTLAGMVQVTPSFADVANQNQAATQVESVNIPDANLRKELNKVLEKPEGASLSAKELATIKDLELTNKGIDSLEGLQYCRNLEKIDILDQAKSNTFNSLTSLQNLKYLDSINLYFEDITDFSYLENTVIKKFSHNINIFASANVDASATEDGKIILKNPCVGFNGKVLVPENLQGATYDKEANVFTWTLENFDKFVLQNSTHKGKVHLKFNVASVKLLFGGHLNINIDLYVGRPNITPEQSINVKNSFDFYGIGIKDGDYHFAQLNYNDNHTMTLKEKGNLYGVGIHPYFKDTYASILAKDKDGNVLFNKAFKGTDKVSDKEETFNLPEGATLDLYHAEGTSGRFTTSDNQTLKQEPGSTYHYMVQNGELVQIKTAPEKQLALNNSIRLKQYEMGNSYLYIENGYLTANNSNVKSYIAITKNGKEVTLDNNNNYTELKAGDKFTIQPLQGSTWVDEPVEYPDGNDLVTDRECLGTFYSSNMYIFKVNNDGSVSLVDIKTAPEKAEVTQGDWTARWDDQLQRYKFTNYTGDKTKIVVPTTFQNKPVAISLKEMSDILNLKGLTNFSANGTNKEIKVLDTDWSELFDSTKATTIDLRGFDTSNVTNMSWLFGHCKSLRSLNISNFDTSNVTDMYGMFAYCRSLTSLDINNFDTSKVINMQFMFGGCGSLTSLDISNFDTSNVTDMSVMFNGCTSLTSLNISNFDTSNVTDTYDMFGYCDNLTSLQAPQNLRTA